MKGLYDGVSELWRLLYANPSVAVCLRMSELGVFDIQIDEIPSKLTSKDLVL